MPGIDYAAVRRAIPMRRVLELLGYEAARRRGDRLRGWCPLQRTCSRESFRVDLRDYLFHCFSCGAGGNQLDLWSATERALHEADVPSGAIWTEKLCTSCDEIRFFSHRRDGGGAGRMVSVVVAT